MHGRMECCFKSCMNPQVCQTLETNRDDFEIYAAGCVHDSKLFLFFFKKKCSFDAKN